MILSSLFALGSADPVDIGLGKEVGPHGKEASGFDIWYTVELALVGLAKEVERCYGATCLIDPNANTLIVRVPMSDNILAADGGVDRCAKLSQERHTVAHVVISDIKSPNVFLRPKTIIDVVQGWKYGSTFCFWRAMAM